MASIVAVIFAVAMGIGSPPAFASDAVPSGDRATEPLWEAGIGAAVLSFPHYRGSDQSRVYVIPAPYLVYRGEIFKADRNGVRGVFFKTDRVNLNVSAGASLPVYSRDDHARAGMPDLKPSVELGPSLDVTLWRSTDLRANLDLRLPVRAAVTVESHPRFIGAEFFPHLNLDVRDPAGLEGWNLGLLTGPVFADARYNRYFYEVLPAYATASRPAYVAPAGGFAGTQFLAALSKRFPRFWTGAFVRYDSLRGATFEESPLVTSKGYFAAGLAISWIFSESAERVPSIDLSGRRR